MSRTHVAGIVGSENYGVAKKTTLIAVKVLNAQGGGYISDIVAGIQWVIQNYTSTKQQSPKGKFVANLSLGGGYSVALNDAVKTAIDAGLLFSVAAGNSAVDACSISPASLADAITVAASNVGDYFSSYSNTGSCVDIIAPGDNILST